MVKCLKFMIVLLTLYVTIQSTDAVISQKDVESCISEVKKSLETQQNTAKKRFNELRIRKVNDIKEQRDERQDNLVSFIQNEKNILSTLKQSAIQDDFDVKLCNDTSTVYDLILNSFKSSADAILADYRGIVDRNHTQNTILVDRLAQNYQLLQKKLDTCQGQQPTKMDCLDEVEDECEMAAYKNEIFDLESSYYAEAERTFIYSKTKVNTLYQGKLREVQAFSSEMKSCYRSVKNINNTTDTDNQHGNSGVAVNPLKFLIVLPLLYKVLL